MASETETKIQLAILRLLQVPDIGVPLTNMRVGELPKVDGPAIDGLPAIRVCPQPGENLDSEPAGFDAGSFRWYKERVAVIYGREGDNATDQAEAQRAREVVLNLIERTADGEFRVTLADVRDPTGREMVWMLKDIRSASFDDSKLAKQYAYLSVAVTVGTTE